MDRLYRSDPQLAAGTVVHTLCAMSMLNTTVCIHDNQTYLVHYMWAQLRHGFKLRISSASLWYKAQMAEKCSSHDDHDKEPNLNKMQGNQSVACFKFQKIV